MEQDQCYACTLCDFMTFSSLNLKQHFRARHDCIPPKWVLTQVSEPICTIIRQADELLHKSSLFSNQVPLESGGGIGESAVTSRISGERVEMVQSSSKPITNFRTDVSDRESNPYPVKLFSSLPANEPFATIPDIKPDPDKIKEEIPDLTLVPSDDDRIVLGHDYQEMNVTGWPSLVTVDALFSADRRIDERNNNTLEETSEYRETESKNRKNHWNALSSNRPEISPCVSNSEAHIEMDSFLQIPSRTAPMSWINTENHAKIGPSGSSICKQLLSTPTFPEAKEQNSVKIEVFGDPQNEKLIQTKVSGVANVTRPARSTLYRRKLKDSDPAKYAEFLEKCRLARKAARQKKKEKWASATVTRAMEEEKEQQLMKRRQRDRRNRERKRAEGTLFPRQVTVSTSAERAGRVSLAGMTPDEVRKHKNRLHQDSRRRRSAQKKMWDRAKAREHMRKKRQNSQAKEILTPAEEPSPSLTPPQGIDLSTTPITPSHRSAPKTDMLSKTLYNFKSILRKGLENDGCKYARRICNLATSSSPRKMGVTHSFGFLSSPAKHSPPKHKQQPSTAKKCANKLISKACDARRKMEQLVKIFYTRRDISHQLLHKRYATKKGAIFVMNVTTSGAFRQFRMEHPGVEIGLKKFASLRPRKVRKIGQVAIEMCLCTYCLNVRYKLDALNRVLARSHLELLPSETRILDLICCARSPGKKWHNIECIAMTCPDCKDSLRTIRERCHVVGHESISWKYWRKSRETKRLDVFSKKGSVGELLGDLKSDLDRPTSSATFRSHLFTVIWQGSQYRDLKFSLSEDEAMILMDFVENRKAFHNQEIKSAHFGMSRITIHPIVLYFKTPNADLACHCLMFLTDDIACDFHVVHNFTLAALEYAKREVANLKRVYLFSDGCAAQYNGKESFADLSLLSGLLVQRIYFGCEHGKGETEGEAGELSQMLTQAVHDSEVNISNAEDLWQWANANMTRRPGLKQRHFFLVHPQDIIRNRPDYDLATVPGARFFHQVERVSDYFVRCRKLACFCSGCKLDMHSCCINKSHVGEYEKFKLKEEYH